VRRYLLDTNTAGDLIARRKGVAERARAVRQTGGRVGIAIPVLAELYYGVEFSSSREKNSQRLRQALSGLIVWPFDEKAAAEFGRVRADLRRRGRPMQIIDVMIAAIALSLGGCIVVSTDSDFLALPGLDTENWLI
jgi:tRNA(fMet)-specific endonuclease VapC